MAETSFRSNNPFRRKGRLSPPAPPPTTLSDDPGSLPSSATINPSGDAPTGSDYFRSQLEALPRSSRPPPSTTFQKPKVVKRVRVQSPPPSPESEPGASDVHSVGGVDEEHNGSNSDSGEETGEDPFEGAPSPVGPWEDERIAAIQAAPAPPPPVSTPPHNSFQQTLEIMGRDPEQALQGGKSSAGGGGSLDVEAFRKLLLSGLEAAPETGPRAQPTGSPGTWRIAEDILDASSTQGGPREKSELGDDDRLGLVSEHQVKARQAASASKKKPPPPSSRHGRLIGLDSSREHENASNVTVDGQQPYAPIQTVPSSALPASLSSSQQPPPRPAATTASGPEPVHASLTHGAESIISEGAASNVPELDPDPESAMLTLPRPPTPPRVSGANGTANSAQALRRPAPPPRRSGHSRSDSRASATKLPTTAMAGALSGLGGGEAEATRRSSVDSTRSRSSSFRSGAQVPIPPPPRRPSHISRKSTSFISQSTASVPSIPPDDSAGNITPSEALEASPHHGARNYIADGAGAGADATATAAIAASAMVTGAGPSGLPESTGSPGQPYPLAKPSRPPPPPARNPSVRLSSGRGHRPAVSNADGTLRRASRESVYGAAAPPPPPPRPKRSAGGGGDGDGRDGTGHRRTSADSLGGASPSANDILADLVALQKEVDALRGRYEKKEDTGS